MGWVDSIFKKSKMIVGNECEAELITSLLDYVYSGKNVKVPRKIQIAAAYDLCIAATYYANITNSGWLYCNADRPRVILPFVNCCPIHAIQKQFHYHKSNKPTSAVIGQATTRVLLLFYQELLKRQHENIKVKQGTEPVDAVFIDETNKIAFLCEIKSSPLLTPALTYECETVTDYDSDGSIVPIGHRPITAQHIINQTLSILIPELIDNEWKPNYYTLGKKTNSTDVSYAFKGLTHLVDDNRFMDSYMTYWMHSYDAYCNINRSVSIFWLTNACGKPSNLPSDWQGGTTCISDEKTSVGMDRTDDIKKGIYQVLKIGSSAKESKSGWIFKVGIISNIHPARHFEVYLGSIKDLVWTIYEDDVKCAKDLPPDWPLYNLFDGIVTFTQLYARDSWIRKTFEGL